MKCRRCPHRRNPLSRLQYHLMPTIVWFRRDLRYTSDAGTPTALGFYHHQKDHDDYELDLWQTYKWRTPVAQWSLDGVPMLTVYEAPTKTK